MLERATLISKAMLLGLFVGATLCCSSPPVPAPQQCEEPTIEGDATDEAWRTMIDAQDNVMRAHAKSPVLSEPAADAVLSLDSAPTFSWSETLAQLAPQRTLPHRRETSTPVDSVRAVLTSITALVIPSAHAHEPPVTGIVYLAEITAPNGDCLASLVTTSTTWTPNDVLWTSMKKSEGEPFSLDVSTAYLTENRVTEGPFGIEEPRSFFVGRAPN
jgi:hypothetical protein